MLGGNTLIKVERSISNPTRKWPELDPDSDQKNKTTGYFWVDPYDPSQNIGRVRFKSVNPIPIRKKNYLMRITASMHSSTNTLNECHECSLSSFSHYPSSSKTCIGLIVEAFIAYFFVVLPLKPVSLSKVIICYQDRFFMIFTIIN